MEVASSSASSSARAAVALAEDSFSRIWGWVATSTSSSGGRRLGMLDALPTGVDFGVVAGVCVFLLILMRVMKYLSDMMRRKMKKRIAIVKAMRAAFKDGFRGKNGYSWDLVIVFNIHKATEKTLKPLQTEFNMKRVLNDLADGGVETKLFYNVQRKLVYCKLRVDYKRLKNEADRIDFKVQLDPFACEAALAEGKTDGDETIWSGVRIPNDKEECPYDPCEHVYAPFRYDTQSQHLYQRYGEEENFFRGVDRMKLLTSILKSKKYDGGCGLDLRDLKFKKCIGDYFFLHDLVELRTLEEKFLRFCEAPWNMPVDDIKDYFGEKVGFYFLYLGHYTTWLALASVLGFFCYCDVVNNDGDPNAPSMPYFAVLMALWTQLFLEFWKRKQVRFAMQWGMRGFEAEARPRPEFIGEVKPDPVLGKPYLYFPRHVALRRFFISSTVVVAFVCVVLTTVFGIFVYELTLRSSRDAVYQGQDQSKTVASILNVMQIQFFNAVYGYVAKVLNDYENHRTDAQFEDALIAKTFVFQFINSFSALFYLAFVKPFIPELDNCYESCMDELSNQLFVILVGQLITGNLTEIGVPAVMQWMNKNSESSQEEYDYEDITEIERESFKADYDVMLGTFADYAELMMQFGYTTLFVASFPLAPMLAFVSNYVEIRVDAWKLCQQSKRPEPVSCEDIGTWQTIVSVMSLAAVLSNSALIAYTGSHVKDYGWSTRNWIFFGISLLIMGLKFLVDVLIPDVPKDVDMQVKRADFVVSKLMYDAQDDVDLAFDMASLKAEYKVRVIDDDPL